MAALCCGPVCSHVQPIPPTNPLNSVLEHRASMEIDLWIILSGCLSWFRCRKIRAMPLVLVPIADMFTCSRLWTHDSGTSSGRSGEVPRTLVCAICRPDLGLFPERVVVVSISIGGRHCSRQTFMCSHVGVFQCCGSHRGFETADCLLPDSCLPMGLSGNRFQQDEIAAASDIQDPSLLARTLFGFSKVAHPWFQVDITQFSPNRIAV